MSRIALLSCVLLVTSCAEVPSLTCFADEPCADAGARGGGSAATGGGGSTATGGGGGGSTAMGGGGGSTAMGGGGSTATGGGGGASEPRRTWGTYGMLGIADRTSSLTFPAPTGLPGYSPETRGLAEMTGESPNCPDWFRGGVLLPDGRVLAVPFCARRFAVVDPVQQTVEWIGPLLPAADAGTVDPPGAFGAAVLGCDGVVYALPYATMSTALRIGPLSDGGLWFDPLPIAAPAPHLLSGGVIARPCSSGQHVILASGRERVQLLDVGTSSLLVTSLVDPSLTGREFRGVARFDDTLSLPAPAINAGGTTAALSVDTFNIDLASDLSTFAGATRYGIARTSTGLFTVTETGTAAELTSAATPLGGLRTPQVVGHARWPTNLLNGWILTSGELVQAWRHTGTGQDTALFDAGLDRTSGGLVLTFDGTVVDLPGTSDGGQSVRFYIPTTPSAPPRALVLSPWFNKL